MVTLVQETPASSLLGKVSTKCALVALAVLTGNAASAPALEPVEVIQKAIKARGAKASSRKPGLYTATGEGKMNLGGAATKYSVTWSAQPPSKVRWEADLQIAGGAATKLLFVVDQKQGWLKIGENPAIPMDDGFRKSFLLQLQVDKASTLVPLLDQGQYTLTSGGESEVNGQKTIALNAKNKTGLEVGFWFDPKTHRPVKQEFSSYDFYGNEVLKTMYLSNYKKIGGILMATDYEIHHDDELFMTLTVQSIKSQERLEESLFAKPE